MSKKANLIISLIIGIIIFGAILAHLGPESIKLIYKNINPFYLVLFGIFTTSVLFFNTWRIQIILSAHGAKAPFWSLLKQHIAGFAVSYTTPSVRVGGEPLKAYMLKKENDIDYKTGSSAIIIDKFVEFLGSFVVGMIGLCLILFLPNVDKSLKLLLALFMLICFIVLVFVYYFSIKGKGPFTYFFNLLRFYKIKKLKNFSSIILEVEEKMGNFFIHHKKEFFWSSFIYFLFGIATYYEFKFLLMAFGVHASPTEIIMSIVVWGIINFVPVPAGLGFQEASQTGLFEILMGSGEIGLALTLLERVRSLFFVSLGFALISHFSGKTILKKFEEEKLT
ncbi:flippase-like domain-containing protein [Candidatus Pacearchaeota archaeon]|nr:flippase-like domain-containing protein [Candidatus Pacearchaeota archaeon]